MSLLQDFGRLAFKKARRYVGSRIGGGGVTPQDASDLGIGGAGQPDGMPADAGTGTDVMIPGTQSAVLGAIQVSPTHVIRSKCPRGYTLIKMPGLLTANVCVLTKVARALGLAAHRHGRGISSRDLRAALRVTRLVKHIEKQLPHHVTHSHSTALARRK